MRLALFISFLFLHFFSFSFNGVWGNDCQKSAGWDIKYIEYQNSQIRTGIKRTAYANPKGNILYLQGLGDSMMNHEPLFDSLNRHGFNIVSFDYRGQGCSSGHMNSSTIDNLIELSQLVWSQYVTSDEKMKLIGWSTGGLVSYKLAYKYPKKVEKIALIAPGIAPRYWIGERMEITEESLTTNQFLNTKNPHVDKIRPRSPLFVPKFALNLQWEAKKSRSYKFPVNVGGYVFLSSDEDTYVNSDKVYSVIKKNASHFYIRSYENTNALHELDNEQEDIARDLRSELGDFFN